MATDFDPWSERDVIAHILTSLADGRGGWMVNPNTDVLQQTMQRVDLRRLIHSADLVIADGMPLIWASRVQGEPLPERVAGSTLIRTMSFAAAEAGVPVFLLGGSEGVAERAAARLMTEFPGLVAGYHCPPVGFESDPMQRASIDEAVATFGPAIYYCGLGFPKQERLMAQLVERFPASWFIGSGASLGFVAGETKRAPLWMQDAGLEWCYRLWQEPRRLFPRYVVHDAPFAARMLTRSLIARARRGLAAKWSRLELR
jgi:N-acetylglucosaminyldiphosphoundecaprenol N-acetyl-beta-D-mannosaminyltransferase